MISRSECLWADRWFHYIDNHPSCSRIFQCLAVSCIQASRKPCISGSWNLNTQICLRDSSNHGCLTWTTNESAFLWYIFPFDLFQVLADCVLRRWRGNPWLIVSLHLVEHYGEDSFHRRSGYRTFTVWLFWYDL